MSEESSNRMKIRYNPYLKTIQYWWLNREGIGIWEPLLENSGLANSKYQHGTLQHHAAEILEIIRDEYCQGVRLELVFEGTENDWADIRRIAEQYGPDHRLQLCEQVTCGLTPAPVALKKIEDIFSRLSANFDSHMEEDDRVREVLENYTRTMRPEIPVYVMGTVSAGKSTFINALIGEEILPSAVNPTTARVFKIIPMSGGDYIKTRIRFQYGGADAEIMFYKEGYAFRNLNKLPDSTLKKYLDEALAGKTVSPAYIYQTLDALNRFKQENDSDVSSLIEVETPFSHSTLPLDRFQFVIYDTPGSNSSTHAEHTESLKAAMKEQTDGLPLILTTSTEMDSNDVQALMDLIRELGGALDDSSKMAIVGKAEALSSSDIEASKKPLSVITKNIPTRIFFLSSILGLGAKKEDMKECVYDNDWKVFRKNREDCIDGETMLYQHDVLTKERFDAICAAGGEANRGTDDRAKLLHNSGLWAVENEIALFAEKYALYNKCQQAQEHLTKAIELTKQATLQKREEQKDKLAQVEGRLTAKEQALLTKLQNAGKQKLGMAFNDYYTKLMPSVPLPFDHVSKKQVDKEWNAANLANSRPPIAAMQDWVDETIHAAWSRWWQTAKKRTEDFWAEQINIYKKTCIKIVNENDALTDEEKEFMEQFILACPGLRSPEISPDVRPLLEEKSFLFFWRWKEFNAKKCVTLINSAINNVIMGSTQTYENAVKKEVNLWTANFRSGLTEKLADFNPDLRRLTEDLRLCCARLEQLEANQKFLEDSEREIRDLFKFKDEWEKQ